MGSKTQDDGLVSFKVRAYKLTAYINNHDKPKELAMACDCYACVDTPSEATSIRWNKWFMEYDVLCSHFCIPCE